MADIQPKNTNTIRVDEIKEKTTSSSVSFPDDIKTDSIAERTASAGVMVGAIFKFFTGGANKLVPTSTTVDVGTSSATEHVRDLFVNKIKSHLAAALQIGTQVAQALELQSAAITRLTLTSAGRLNTRLSHTGFTSGGEIETTTVGTTTTNVAATLYGYTIANTNTQVILRLNLISRDNVTGNQSYVEVAATGSRAGGGAVAGSITNLHTVGTALHTLALAVIGNTLFINIVNASGSNTTYGIGEITAYPISTST